MNQYVNLISVYQDTKDFFLKNRLYAGRSKRYRFEDIDKELNTINNIEKYNNICTIKVLNMDTLVATREYIHPLVMNFASDYNPGGGVHGGAMAQEEELFRRTNYFTSLNKKYVDYPLAEDEVVFTPNILILKDEKYNHLPALKSIDCLAVAAIRHPKLNDNNYNKKDEELMKRKIESIYEIGILYGHDTLILGAFGCGVFRNPPHEVARIFKEMNEKYKGYYKNIVFAIIGDSNYHIFKAIIENN